MLKLINNILVKKVITKHSNERIIIQCTYYIYFLDLIIRFKVVLDLFIVFVLLFFLLTVVDDLLLAVVLLFLFVIHFFGGNIF